MKQKEKAGKEEKGEAQSNENDLRKIKQLKKKAANLDKALKDADASHDDEGALKLQKKLDYVKGEINYQKDKLQQKIVKNHQKIQAKETRKRMKQNAKKAKRINDNRREPFYVRWYRKWKKG